MNWLARLKNASSAETDATKAMKPRQAQPEAGFVGFVAPTLAAFEKIKNYAVAVNDAVVTATDNPDRWSWPVSDAMNTVEIGTFMARMARFTTKGMTIADSEVLADKLVIRDRDQDDRKVCLECRHIAGHGAGSWHCGNWQASVVAMRSRDAQLPADLVVQLQRCDGFTAQLASIPKGISDDHDRD
jgi:hypothetical protein